MPSLTSHSTCTTYEGWKSPILHFTALFHTNTQAHTLSQTDTQTIHCNNTLNCVTRLGVNHACNGTRWQNRRLVLCPLLPKIELVRCAPECRQRRSNPFRQIKIQNNHLPVCLRSTLTTTVGVINITTAAGAQLSRKHWHLAALLLYASV